MYVMILRCRIPLACAVTHAMTKKHLTTCDNAKSDLQSLSRSSSAEDDCPELVDTFMTELNGLPEDGNLKEPQIMIT